jgi:anaphase-promoting complex subunit 10
MGSPNAPEANSQRREIGDLAVWTLSSAKPGNGVEQLRDDSVSTFWQSDGTQPHFVNIQFLKKMRVQEISMYLDFKTDESYTPQKISIRVGNSFYELQEVKLIDFEEPIGWFNF